MKNTLHIRDGVTSKGLARAMKAGSALLQPGEGLELEQVQLWLENVGNALLVDGEARAMPGALNRERARVLLSLAKALEEA